MHRSLPISSLEQDMCKLGRVALILCWTDAENMVYEPLIEGDQGGIRGTFLKDIYSGEYLGKLGLIERQVRAVMYIKEHGGISNSGYQTVNGISKPSATRDLADLVSRGLLSKIGLTGKGTKYVKKIKGS